MTIYNIYGLGAALVDTEIDVSDAFLSRANIDKGVMTLVSEDRQYELLAALASEGHKMIRKCGGSVCNSVVAATSLGAKAFFSGKVADDSDGELYINDLQDAGRRLSQCRSRVGYHWQMPGDGDRGCRAHHEHLFGCQ